jgi:hypothetical protein
MRKILFRSLALLVYHESTSGGDKKNERLGECVIIEIHTSNIECESLSLAHISLDVRKATERLRFNISKLSMTYSNMEGRKRTHKAQRMIEQSHRKLFNAMLKAIR